MCRQSGLYVRLQPDNLYNDAERLRPDIEIKGLRAETILGDVGVTFPIRPSLTQSQSTVSGQAAQKYSSDKHRKYDSSSANNQCQFVPFIFESRGFWGPEFKEFFEEVILHSSLINGTSLGALRTYWKRRISATLQKAVARTVLSKTKRLNAPAFMDEANYFGAIEDESGDSDGSSDPT